jgi:hypothetical protein
MRVSVLLKLVLFVTTVWAGGYQGVLERIMLYYAYEIDALNDPADQSIGWACRGQYTPGAANPCPGGWQPPQSRGPRANFNELIGPLSRLNRNDRRPWARDAAGNPLPLADGVNGLDVERTGVNLYNMIIAQTERPDPNNPGTNLPGFIPNPPAYKMRRGATDNYVDFLADLGRMVQETANRGGNAAAHRPLFEGFQRVNELVLDARVGDHGQFQIAGIQQRLAGTGITVQTRQVGSGNNPATGNPWQTVDWRQTIDQGVTDTGRTRQQVTADVEAAAADFYENDGAARDHKPVIDSTRRTQQRMASCIG